MVRFLQTSDWQLGMRAIQARERARDVRSARLEALQRIVEIAQKRRVDFVLLAGDTFEDHDVDDFVVKKCVAALAQLGPIPVYVLPGNHDPLVAGSLWDQASWRRATPNVILLREAREYGAPADSVLYACPLRQKRSNNDPTDWIPVRAPGDSRIRIGIAHGALDVLPGGATNFPIDAARVTKTGLDYLALGDWHGKWIGSRIAYSGTHEGTKFGETDPGHVLIVDIPSMEAEPKLESVRVARLLWREVEAHITEPSDVADLEATIRRDARPNDTLLRVKIDTPTALGPDAMGRLEVLQREIGEEFLFLDWIQPESSDVRELAIIPPGVLSAADTDLAAIAAGKIPEGPGQAFAGRDPSHIGEARKALHRLARRNAE